MWFILSMCREQEAGVVHTEHVQRAESWCGSYWACAVNRKRVWFILSMCSEQEAGVVHTEHVQ